MARRTLPLLMLCLVLFAAVHLLTSCASDEEDWLGLNPRSVASADAAEQLGNAVLFYFAGRYDLEEVRALVGSSAQEDLTEMLSLLTDPISFSIEGTVGRTSSTKRKTVLRFVEAETQQPVKFTISVDVQPDKTTIESIEPYDPE
ncbi:MAG: hypothetical protein JXA57_11070 [Armatimonadetes bacterium]|nr:hypothetical protein [Armatimonadota bacterium]